MDFNIGLLIIFFLALFIIVKIIGLSISIIKKTVVLCLLLFLLYALFANAEVTKVYSNYILPYETLTVNKMPFMVSLEDHDKLMLKYGLNYFFINRGDCQKVYNLKFCFGNTMWDIDEKKEKINLTVYSIAPTITITRTIDNPTMRVGEEAEITTTIKNGDGLSAENFSFIDTFTPEFNITEVHTCNKNNDSVYWLKYLRVNDSVECRYTIKALDEIERSFKAKVEYFDGFEMQEKYSDTLAIKVNPLIDIKTEFNDTDKKIYLGQTVYLKINITNKNDEDMDLRYFDIYVPDGLEYLGTTTIRTRVNSTDYKYFPSGSLTKIGSNVYRYSSDELNENQSKIIAPAFRAKFIGKSNIYMKAEYETENVVRTKEKMESIEAISPELKIHSNLKSKDESSKNEFDTNVETPLKIYIENPIGSSIYFKNIHLWFNTTLGNFSDVYLDRLNESNTIFVLNTKLVTPKIIKKTTYNFDVVADYETQYDEKKQKSFDIDIDVKPIEGLVITQAISKSNVESGEEFDVEVKVQNKRLEDISDVRVFDTMHDEFSRKGISSNIININGLDTVSVYKYKMKAPQVKETTKYKFITTANYSKENVTKSAEKEFIITVMPKKLEITVTRNVPTPLFTGQIVDITYIIENKEKEQLKNILFRFPIQQKFDLVGNKEYFIEKLDPGEKLTIVEKHKVRAKLNGSQTLEPTELVYYDDLGNIFRKNSSKATFDVKFGYIDGPAFLLNKTVSKKKINKSESVDVVLTVRNIGTEKGQIKVSDMGKVRDIELSAKEETKFGYSISFDKIGKFELEPAVGEYVYLNKTITTTSNKPAIEIGSAEKVEGASKEITKEEVAVTEKPKGFIAQLKDLYLFLKKAIFGG